MKTLDLILIVATLAFGYGCAKQDWIDRTLTTEDVTGTWETSTGSLRLDLRQEGQRITGSMRIRGDIRFAHEGPVEGTLAGDQFSFKQANGPLVGQLTVSGDEMNGRAWGTSVATSGPFQLSLRRIDKSSPPASPPR